MLGMKVNRTNEKKYAEKQLFHLETRTEIVHRRIFILFWNVSCTQNRKVKAFIIFISNWQLRLSAFMSLSLEGGHRWPSHEFRSLLTHTHTRNQMQSNPAILNLECGVWNFFCFSIQYIVILTMNHDREASTRCGSVQRERREKKHSICSQL